MLLSGSLEVLCSGPASRLLAQSQIFWAPFSAAAPLGGHREISSAGLLRWEGLLQSHVYQYIQRDEASLLPTEDSDEAVPFFFRGHTDLVLFQCYLPLVLAANEGANTPINLLMFFYSLNKVGWKETNPVLNLSLPPVFIGVF